MVKRFFNGGSNIIIPFLLFLRCTYWLSGIPTNPLDRQEDDTSGGARIGHGLQVPDLYKFEKTKYNTDIKMTTLYKIWPPILQ